MINYKVGDLFKVIEKDKSNDMIIISHIVNNIGAWGSGFVVPLGRMYPLAEQSYRDWYSLGYDVNSGKRFNLGNSQFIYDRESNVIVQNMIAQHGVISKDNPCPIRYDDLEHCLESLVDLISNLSLRYKNIKLMSPAFGSERAGGKWCLISYLIESILYQDIDIYCLTQEQSDKLQKEDYKENKEGFSKVWFEYYD